MTFFNDNLLLYTDAAKEIYFEVRGLPIIDYHCHLDQTKIRDDAHFANIGELWLSGDHYKWRAMRLSGVGEDLSRALRAGTTSSSPTPKSFPSLRATHSIIGRTWS